MADLYFMFGAEEEELDLSDQDVSHQQQTESSMKDQDTDASDHVDHINGRVTNKMDNAGTSPYWNQSTLHERLQAWYDDEDDDEEDDEDNVSAAAGLLHGRQRSNIDLNFGYGYDDDDDDAIREDYPSTSPITTNEKHLALRQIYAGLQSGAAAQRIDTTRQLGTLLYDVPPTDAVDFVVDLLYTLADDTDDDVRQTLAEELDKILTYFFERCMEPSDTQSNKAADEDETGDASMVMHSENQDTTDKDVTDSSKDDDDVQDDIIISGYLQSGAMTELLQKLLLDPSSNVAEATRDALIRMFADRRLPESVLNQEILYEVILSLDNMEDGSSSMNGGFSLGIDNGFSIGGFGGPALGRPICAAINVLCHLVAHLDTETCEQHIIPRLLSWAGGTSFAIRRDAVPLVCALAARLPERLTELLILYSNLSVDPVWHVRQACARHLDRLIALAVPNEEVHTAQSAESSSSDTHQISNEEMMHGVNNTMQQSGNHMPPSRTSSLPSNNAAQLTPLPSNVGVPSEEVLNAPGNEHVKSILEQPVLSEDILRRRTAWVIERYNIFLNDTSRGVREAAWEAIGRICAAFPRGQVPHALVTRYITMPIPQAGGNDATDQERIVQCAYNMPAMVLMLGPERWPELRECYATLVGDPQLATRRTLACSLPVLGSMLHPADVERDLFPAFQHFMQDVGEVRTAAIQGIVELTRHMPSGSQLRILSNIVVWFRAASNDWRAREMIMHQFAKLCQLFSMDDIISNLQVIEDALMDRVAQVRDAAINVFAIIVGRTLQDQTPVAQLIDALDHISHSHEYRMRLMYLKLCTLLLERGFDSSPIMRERLLPRVVDLSFDQVYNVRLAVVKLFMAIAPRLASDATLDTYAAVVLERVQSDKDYSIRSLAVSLAPYCPSAPMVTLPVEENGHDEHTHDNMHSETSYDGGENSIMKYEMDDATGPNPYDMEVIELDMANNYGNSYSERGSSLLRKHRRSSDDDETVFDSDDVLQSNDDAPAVSDSASHVQSNDNVLNIPHLSADSSEHSATENPSANTVHCLDSTIEAVEKSTDSQTYEQASIAMSADATTENASEEHNGAYPGHVDAATSDTCAVKLDDELSNTPLHAVNTVDEVMSECQSDKSGSATAHLIAEAINDQLDQSVIGQVNDKVSPPSSTASTADISTPPPNAIHESWMTISSTDVDRVTAEEEQSNYTAVNGATVSNNLQSAGTSSEEEEDTYDEEFNLQFTDIKSEHTTYFDGVYRAERRNSLSALKPILLSTTGTTAKNPSTMLTDTLSQCPENTDANEDLESLECQFVDDDEDDVMANTQVANNSTKDDIATPLAKHGSNKTDDASLSENDLSVAAGDAFADHHLCLPHLHGSVAANRAAECSQRTDKNLILPG